MCFENRVLSKILGLRWSKKETEGSYITSVMFCSSDQILFGWANQDNEMDGIIYCVCVCVEKREMHTGFRWRNVKQKDHLKDLGIDERIILK